MADLEALHTGVIKLGDYEIPCYVLNTEERVLSQREVVRLLTGGRESGNLGQYLSARAVQGTLPAHLQGDWKDNVLIFRAGNIPVVHGIRGGDVIDICKAYLDARQLGKLMPSQAHIAQHSEMFISASAKTGIDAIIDEATGFQHFRKAAELQEKFTAYLQAEYREWTETFPRQFFMQLYRLEGIVPPQMIAHYPKRFGKYIMEFVYDTMDRDIANWLRENNPSPGGKQHHHQKFNDFGYKQLTDHLMSVLGIMKASLNMENFKDNLQRAFPGWKRASQQRRMKNRNAPAEAVQVKMEFTYLPTANTPTPDERAAQEDDTEFGNAMTRIAKTPWPPKKKA